MSSESLAPVVQQADLCVSPDILGGGGQAKAVRMVIAPNGEACAFKLYDDELRARLNTDALVDLVRWRRALDQADLERLDHRCAWPRAVVMAEEQIAGFLMNPAPRSMWRQRLPSARPKLRHLEELVRPRDKCPIAAEYVARPTKLAYWDAWSKPFSGCTARDSSWVTSNCGTPCSNWAGTVVCYCLTATPACRVRVSQPFRPWTRSTGRLTGRASSASTRTTPSWPTLFGAASTSR